MNVLTIARGGRPKSINLERGLPGEVCANWSAGRLQAHARPLFVMVRGAKTSVRCSGGGLDLSLRAALPDRRPSDFEQPVKTPRGRTKPSPRLRPGSASPPPQSMMSSMMAPYGAMGGPQPVQYAGFPMFGGMQMTGLPMQAMSGEHMPHNHHHHHQQQQQQQQKPGGWRSEWKAPDRSAQHGNSTPRTGGSAVSDCPFHVLSVVTDYPFRVLRDCRQIARSDAPLRVDMRACSHC